MRGRSSLALGLVAAVFVGGATAAPPVALGPPATAAALAIQIVGPGNTPVTATGEAIAPPDAGIPTAPFAYPADGSVAGAASTTASVSASASDGTATATTQSSTASRCSRGEITADDVRASVSSAGTVGDLSDSAVTNLVVLGHRGQCGAECEDPARRLGARDRPRRVDEQGRGDRTVAGAGPSPR